MPGHQVVHIRCVVCGRWGSVSDPAAVKIAMDRGDAVVVRCRRDLGGCGAGGQKPGEIRLGWDSGVNPYQSGDA